MQNHPQLLLRRPLPAKPPKLPACKRIRTAKAVKFEPRHVKFTQDKTTLSERDTTNFPDVSRKQLQTPISIQNLSLDYHVEKRGAAISIPRKPPKPGPWHIPETATGVMFFPTCHSASSRVYGKETKRKARSRKPGEPSKIKKIYVDHTLKDILILSSQFSQPSDASSLAPTLKPEGARPPHLPVSKSRTFTYKRPLIDGGAAAPRPLPRVTPAQVKSQRFGHLQQNMVLLNITQFPGTIFLPAPVLPRKPQRQSAIEMQVAENENLEGVLRQGTSARHEGLSKSRKPNEREAKVIHGEGLNTIKAIQYETLAYMTNLAVVNCQIHGRNALNLKGFFIMDCPDLTSLAFQLIYLNLSFNNISSFPTQIFCLKYLQILILRNNPIKTIPSGIQQLRFLRVFNIAFNLITNLPPGLFYLFSLEELNISYNSIEFIPNEIQQLRSLKRLFVDGNDLTSFPPGILKLNLKKIQFENNFTYPCLWKENSLNSPQSLVQLASLFFLKNNLQKYYDAIPGKIQVLLKCASQCEWCQGPRFGEGYRVIQSCNVFGAARLPVLFHVCSSSCYQEVNEHSVL